MCNFLTIYGYNIFMKKFIRNKYIIATFLCLIIYLIYLKMMEIYPFGEYSILKCDLYQQYINFFCYFRKILLNNKSIIMSWNLGLANNFYTTFAYYLVSPLNLFVVFFNISNMDIFVEIITYVKIALMANFMILFLDKSCNFKQLQAILFGLIYAYSSYVICYSFHIMWLDCLYMLPIILIYVDKYIETGYLLPFILSLGYAILTNYYIGYMVAFFSGIYYLVKYFINGEKRGILEILKNICKFVFAIIVSFGIGMIVILPSLLQLKGKMNLDIQLIKIEFDKIKLFINVIFNNYVYMFTQKSCFVFSSTFTILLLPMYYLNKKIKIKEKLAFTLVVIFLLLPIISPFLNKLWHAFTIPNCFNYRYSFTLTFVLILMAAREFQNLKYSSKWHFIIGFLIFSGLTLIEIVFLKRGYLESDGYTVSANTIFLSYVIYLIMLILTYIIFLSSKYIKNKSIIRIINWKYPINYTKNDLKKIITLKFKKNIYYFTKILLFIVVIIDLIIGAKSGQNNNDKYLKRKVITQYDDFMNYFTQKLQNSEIERIVFEPDKFGSNMALKYGYSNIGFFTSARNRETLKSMYRLGYNVQMDEQLWITSYSGTFFNYSIAGVKYYITKNRLENNEIYGFEFDEKYNDLYIYKNKNAFNIGYYLSENVEESYNPFKMQNCLIESLTGKNNRNFNKNEDFNDKYFQKIENSNVLESEKKITFNKKTKEYIIKYKVKAKKDCNIYLASDYDLQVYIKNEPQFENYSNIWSFETGIKQIKNLKKDEELEFTVTTKQNLELLYIYVSNNEEIQKVLDSKNKNNFNNVKIKKHGITGTANFLDDGYLVFTISYDNCWKIYVDGKEEEKEAVDGCFLGVKLKRGTHNIEIKAGFSNYLL